MGKLEELRQAVADMFENATEKEEIDKVSRLSNIMDDVEKEQKALETENKEILKDYKELIKHVSIERADAPSREVSKEAPKFEDFFK